MGLGRPQNLVSAGWKSPCPPTRELQHLQSGIKGRTDTSNLGACELFLVVSKGLYYERPGACLLAGCIGVLQSLLNSVVNPSVYCFMASSTGGCHFAWEGRISVESVLPEEPVGD